MKLNDHIFTVGNKLRGIKSKKLYNVVGADLDLCFAFVKDEQGKLKIVSWMYPGGGINESVLSQYEWIQD